MRINIFWQGVVVVAIAALLTAITYWIKGEPQRYSKDEAVESGIPLVVPEGYVSTEQIFSRYGGRVVWVDARSRNQWKSDGVKGSLFISSDPREDMNALLDAAVPRLFEAECDKLPIVVYCANKGCSDSKLVAEKIRELELETPVFLLFGGFGAVVDEIRIVRSND